MARKPAVSRSPAGKGTTDPEDHTILHIKEKVAVKDRTIVVWSGGEYDPENCWISCLTHTLEPIIR